jgi:hypothetical protein
MLWEILKLYLYLKLDINARFFADLEVIYQKS